VAGIKHLDPQTLDQAYGVLGRLAGQLSDADDVEVTITEDDNEEEAQGARGRGSRVSGGVGG
jgi:hypothetical protein